jgi:hypothetical protein
MLMLVMVGLLFVPISNHASAGPMPGIANAVAPDLAPDAANDAERGAHCHCQPATRPDAVRASGPRVIESVAFRVTDDREPPSVIMGLPPEPPRA